MTSAQRALRAILLGLCAGMLLVALVGCEAEDATPLMNGPGPQNIPSAPPATLEELGAPAHEVPDLKPQAERDPSWDCSKTGNIAIDTWKRANKCGGKLDGE